MSNGMALHGMRFRRWQVSPVLLKYALPHDVVFGQFPFADHPTRPALSIWSWSILSASSPPFFIPGGAPMNCGGLPKRRQSPPNAGKTLPTTLHPGDPQNN
jgi:hypothetical protein